LAVALLKLERVFLGNGGNNGNLCISLLPGDGRFAGGRDEVSGYPLTALLVSRSALS